MLREEESLVEDSGGKSTKRASVNHRHSWLCYSALLLPRLFLPPLLLLLRNPNWNSYSNWKYHSSLVRFVRFANIERSLPAFLVVAIDAAAVTSARVKATSREWKSGWGLDVVVEDGKWEWEWRNCRVAKSNSNLLVRVACAKVKVKSEAKAKVEIKVVRIALECSSSHCCCCCCCFAFFSATISTAFGPFSCICQSHQRLSSSRPKVATLGRTCFAISSPPISLFISEF